MKEEKIKAFSLIELIVVISILIIVSTSGVFYFTTFIDDLSFKKTINDVKNNFETLENKINKKEIFDYEINLSK
jgi:prepilin-type N-terminal cleavage/methylation domain-containing protein